MKEFLEKIFKKRHKEYTGNCWTVWLVPKFPHNDDDIFRTSIVMVPNLYDVFDSVLNSINAEDSPIENVDDYQIIIDSGAALQWAGE